MREPSTHPARRLYRIGAAFAVATGLLAIYSCILIVEQEQHAVHEQHRLHAAQPHRVKHL